MRYEGSVSVESLLILDNLKMQSDGMAVAAMLRLWSVGLALSHELVYVMLGWP